MKTLLVSTVVLFIGLFAQAQDIVAPNVYVEQNEIGDNFFFQHEVENYFEYLANQSPLMEFVNYGKTYEGRKLNYGVISSSKNKSYIDKILKSKTKMDKIGDQLIIWLSFGVHGNEAGATNTAPYVAHSLLTDPEYKTWLEDAIIIIDPCVNPDGYARYVNWYRGNASKQPNPNPEALTHQEPAPTGRPNHYRFDLNRDWAWQTQIESASRIPHFYKWQPHVHADFHEMGHDDHYYFAPGANPVVEEVTPWQMKVQQHFGDNHARYFDKNGWLFYTKELYDLFYPSYGDTYPLLNGAIGMTYEQAGHGMSGLHIEMENSDTLKLSHRIEHHHAVALSTIETAIEHEKDLLDAFSKFKKNSNYNPKYKWFVLSLENNEQKWSHLKSLLDKNFIEYKHVSNTSRLAGYCYHEMQGGMMTVKTGDVAIATNQFQGRLVSTLFDPVPMLKDSNTYDITAWALPFAYGMKALATNMSPSVDDYEEVERTRSHFNHEYTVVAIENEGLNSLKAVGDLMKKGYQLRHSEKEIENGGRTWKAGTFFWTKADNRLKMKTIQRDLESICKKHTVNFQPLKSAMSIKGSDLGSEMVKFIKIPKIALITGDGIDDKSFGETWYFFERVLNYPVEIFNKNQMDDLAKSDFNQIIIPKSNGKLNLETLEPWVKDGGKLILIDRTAYYAMRSGHFGVKLKEKTRASKSNGQGKYGEQIERSLRRRLPGAVVELQIDPTHPMMFNMEYYASLKLGSIALPLMENGWNVAFVPENYNSAGMIGEDIADNLEQSLVYGVRENGAGSVVYMVDNPLFRAFWHNGHHLFANTIFLVGNK